MIRARVSARPGVGVLVTAVLVGAVPLVGAQPASADLVDPPGSCQVVAGWAGGGFSVDSTTADPDAVIEVPRSDSVAWTTLLAGPPAGTERQIAGSLRLALPFPLGSVSIDEWSGPSTTVTDSGTRDYDLPAVVPAGVVFQVRGEHYENGALFCTGSALMRIAG